MERTEQGGRTQYESSLHGVGRLLRANQPVLAGGSSGLLSFVLSLVGAAGLVGTLLAGRATDSRGAERSLRHVLSGHTVALALAAGLVFTGIGNRHLLAPVVASWAVFARALTPPVQGSLLSATRPSAGMTALSLNVAGLYLGTGVAAAVGGAVVGTLGVAYVPLAAAVLMALSFLLSPSAPPRSQAGVVRSAGPTSASG